MLWNAGKTFDIYQIASLLNKALLQQNIISVFSSTEIYSLDHNIFDSSDFLWSSVRDHANQTKKLQTPSDFASTSNFQIASTPEATRPIREASERKKQTADDGKREVQESLLILVKNNLLTYI